MVLFQEEPLQPSPIQAGHQAEVLVLPPSASSSVFLLTHDAKYAERFQVVRQRGGCTAGQVVDV